MRFKLSERDFIMRFVTNQDFIIYIRAVIDSTSCGCQRSFGVKIGMAENTLSDIMLNKRLVDTEVLATIISVDPDLNRGEVMKQWIEKMHALGLKKLRSIGAMLTTIGIEEPEFKFILPFVKRVMEINEFKIYTLALKADVSVSTLKGIMDEKRIYIQRCHLEKIEKLSNISFKDFCSIKENVNVGSSEAMGSKGLLETLTKPISISQGVSAVDSMKEDFIELLKDLVPRRIDPEKVYNDISDKVDVTLAEIRESSNPTQLTDKLKWLLITQHLKGLMQGHVFWLEGSMDRIGQKLK